MKLGKSRSSTSIRQLVLTTLLGFVGMEFKAQPGCMPETAAAGPFGGGGNPCITLQNGGTFGLGNDWSQQSFFVPGPVADPALGANDPEGFHHRPTAQKTVEVSVHVWMKDYNETPVGYYQIEDDPDGLNRQLITDWIEQVSENYFENAAAPTDPAVPAANQYLTNPRVKLKLRSIHWWENSANYWGPISQAHILQCSNTVLANMPGLADTYMIHLVWGQNLVGPNQAQYLTWPIDQWQHTGACALSSGTMNPLWDVGLMQYQRHPLAHEIAHSFGLKHTYINSSPTEGMTSGAFDFLPDVFSCYQQTGMDAGWTTSYCPGMQGACAQDPNAAGIAFCPLAGNPCAPNDSPNDPCTNNIMHQNWGGTSMSNLQMGRVHRTLTMTNMSKYASGYNPVPFALALGSETWNWPMKFYQDIRIRSGQTLTIHCELQMVGQARIVVEAGGRLIIDGGKITNGLYYPTEGLYHEPWRGIEIWGNATQGQVEGTGGYLLQQGLIEIINGGIIENAEIGVYLGKPGDPTKAGGVIRFEGTAAEPPGVIRNCRTGVKFDPYTALSSNGLAALNNRSSFAHARFEWTDDFDNIHQQNNPIVLADLNGVRVSFKGCAFEHSSQYPEYSSELGCGIRAHNSTVWVTNAGASPNVFTGLDHGVHATASSSSPRLTVIGAQFNSNVCGVYADGLRLPFIRNNTFSYGDRDVTLDNIDEQFWQQRHRGVFLTRCNALRVLDNTLNGVSEPVAVTEGIVIGYTNTGSESIRSNTVNGIDRAYVGEGVSANTGAPASIGLQYLCNTNNGNEWNIWSRIANGSDVGSWLEQTMRLNQGWQNVPALNYLDNGVNSALDLRVSTQSLITYWHVAAPNYAPTSVQGLVAPTLSGPQVLYGCPLIVSNGTDQLALESEVNEARLAYANLRFLYANLIDGGSTDEVLDEISDAWPQDYWDLRAFLLNHSPYLSVEALKEAMDKPGFPDAMRAEICIANPEATQRDGFLRWLEFECIAPLPEQLLENIMASWDVRTYRATLEMQMGAEHLRMSEAAYTLSDLLAADDEEEGTDLIAALEAVQALRTAEARYDEAMHLIDRKQYSAARAVIMALPDEHELRGPQVVERARMLTYISFLEDIYLDGRTEAQLTQAELAELEAFIDVEHDRPTNWASHLLCYNYGICRSPYTGDADEEPKAFVRRPAKQTITPTPKLELKPNPANAWVVVTYDLLNLLSDQQLVFRDALGRVVHQAPLASVAGQELVDTRGLTAGAYTVELHQDAAPVESERLIIQP